MRPNPMHVLVLLLSLAAGIFFWHSPVLWPVKLLVVMVHETGHAIATLLVGGSVDRVVLAADESGLCLSRIPQSYFGRIVVFSAGYVGSSIAGALLLVATVRWRMHRGVLAILCVWLVVMGAIYAGDLFTFAFCAATAVVLGLCARFLPDSAAEGLGLFLAAFCALYAVIDLRDDLWNSAVRDRSDAALLAEQTWVPAIVWALVWTVVSLIVITVATRFALAKKPAPKLSMKGLR